MKYLSRFLVFISFLVFMSCENLMLIDAAQLYFVNFETNGGTQVLPYRTDVIEISPVSNKEDAEFLGWYFTADCIGERITFPLVITSNVTLYAKWLQKYQVTFETYGGSEISGYKTSEIKDIPITLKDDNVFMGWYTTPEFEGEEISFPYEVKGPVVLYAKWEQIFTVHFETNGGTEISDFRGISIIEKPESSKEGYVLSDWYSDDKMTTPVSFPYKLTNDILLYAKWVESSNTKYTVEYYQQNTNMSSYTLSETKLFEGQTNSLTNAKAINYTGFHALNYSQSIIKADGTSVVKIYYDRNKYTVHFNSNGGTGTMSDQTFYYGVSKILLKNKFKYNAHAFLGWAKTAGMDYEFSDEQIVVNLSEKNNEVINLYAKWLSGFVVTSSEISNMNLSGINEACTIKVNGNISTSTLYELAAKIKTSTNGITLDLSNATGITEINGDFSSWGSIFAECKKLNKLILPNTLKSIGNRAFQYCSFTSVTIPDSVTSIGSYAFLSCPLNEVIMGKGVKSIGEWAFGLCNNLSSIILPKSLTTIGQCAFYDLQNLLNVTFEDKSTKWTCYHSTLASSGYVYTVSVDNSGLNAVRLKTDYANYNWIKN